MKVISLNGSSDLRLKKTCAAIGILDGMHRGHQYLLKQMLARAHQLGARPVVITFFPHPAHVLRPDLSLEYLMPLTQRLRRLSDLGVALCVVVHFNRSFAKIHPQKFIKDILVKELGIKALFVGEGFKFGKDRSGDIALFQKLAPEYGYEMHALPSRKQGRVVISSTRIRQFISEGKLNEAAKFLGRAVSVGGTVVKGSQRGKGLGYPTANINCEDHEHSSVFILPPNGVYVVRALLGTKEYPAIVNIGTRPSFEKQISKRYVEAHILDFSRNIYGKHLELKFLKKVRSEKKFPSPQHLIRQIQKDETFARKYFKALSK